jgi:hypothetical protein
MYQRWGSMKQRCNNAKCPAYRYYGAKGVKVCQAWEDSFEQFALDMGQQPTPESQIDRIDTTGNYEPSNCRWVSPLENARNKRYHYKIDYNGQTVTVAQSLEAMQCPIKPSLVIRRLQLGHTLCEAVSMTTRPRKSKRYIIWQGERITEAKLSQKLGFHRDLITIRLKRGWPLELAASTPAKLGQKINVTK